MKLSKANLAVAGVAGADARDPALHRVHVEEDGSTAASNGRAIMAVEPVDPERAARFPDVEKEEDGPGPGGVGVSLQTVREALSSVPKASAKRPSLGYVQVTRCDAREVELMGTDGERKRKTSGMPMRGRFPDWRRAVGPAMHGKRVRVCVDRRTLIKILQALDKAAPDPGNRNPVFLELSGDGRPIIARVHNAASNQRAVALVKPLGVEGERWLEPNEWERGLCGPEVIE